MTFEEFSAAVRLNVWPEGEAENLATRHEAWIHDCLIDLQTKVPCERENHVDPYNGSRQFFQCGATVVEAPRGLIRRVWTETAEAGCERVFYDPVPFGQMECLTANRSMVACAADEPYGYYDGPTRGSLYTGGYDDADKPCRSGYGYVSLHEGFLYLFPYLQSDELAVVEWKGIKRDWEDADIVTSDRDVKQAVEYYLTGFGALWDDSDEKRGKLFYEEDMEKPGLYQRAVMKLIWRCRQERRIEVPMSHCFDNSGGLVSSGCGC